MRLGGAYMSDLHFLDVGVWKGRTTGFLLEQAPTNIQAYLFEPDPRRMESLEQRFKNDSRVSFYEAALTDTNEPGVFYVPAPGGEGSSLYADKKTSVGADTTLVDCINAFDFISNLPPGPIVLYSNCEGGEFNFMPLLLNSDLHKRIVLWSIAFHHGDRKIPSMKPAYWEIEKRMNELGIENVPGHFGKGDIKAGKLEKFIKKVLEHVPSTHP